MSSIILSREIKVTLDQFSSQGFDRGASRLKEALWIAFGNPFLQCFIPGSKWRVALLRAFGTTIGKATVWKPNIRVKFPWRLAVGSHSWIGEDVWIDNLAQITIGSHVCISQGAYLCTGNHDWSLPSFDLITEPIKLETGVWIGARAIVAPGTHAEEGAVLTAGSSAGGRLERYKIYQGNKAAVAGNRTIKTSTASGIDDYKKKEA